MTFDLIQYSRTSLIRFNWDGKPSVCAENPDNWIFLIDYTGSFKFSVTIYSMYLRLSGPGGSVGIATELRAGRSGIESILWAARTHNVCSNCDSKRHNNSY